MGRPVKITTPIPTLDEFAANLGLSKKRQRELAPVYVERREGGGYAIRKAGSTTTEVRSTQREAVERARQIKPNGLILVERKRGVTARARDEQK